MRHGLTAETVIDALEAAEDYAAFEMAVTADYDAQSDCRERTDAEIGKSVVAPAARNGYRKRAVQEPGWAIVAVSAIPTSPSKAAEADREHVPKSGHRQHRHRSERDRADQKP